MKSNRSFTFDELLTGNRSEEFIESAYPFMKLMMQYQCAMLEVRTKFEVLNTELSLDSDRNPIESISCRIKKPISIAEKLKRKGLEVSLQSIEENLHDVAGIRVVCFFSKDIYKLADKICSQDDIHLLEKERLYRKSQAQWVQKSSSDPGGSRIFLPMKRNGCRWKYSFVLLPWISGQVLNTR